VRQRARQRVAQGFAAGRSDVVGAAPDMNLLLPPFLAGVILVQAREIAIVALVQRLVLDDGNVGLVHFREQQIKRILRALEGGGEGNVEDKPLRLQLATGFLRFGDALRREIDVAPAGEEVLEIPFALAVADKYEKTIGHSFGS